MKLVAPDTPQSDRDLALWMEQVIVSPKFAQWLAELSAVRNVEGSDSRDLDFESFLGDRFSQISDYGLISLSREQMCQLLAHPEHLLQLQKRICLHESEYWSNLFNQPSATTESERERTNIALFLGPEAVVLARQGRVSSQSKSVYRLGFKYISIALVLVAILTGAGYWVVGYLQHQRALSADWDWQAQIKSIPISTSKEYFEMLAQQADQWYTVRPKNMAQLKTRFEKLQSNLNHLVNDAGTPIKEIDRNWLKQASLQWLAKCNAVLKLDDFDEALREADALCVQMIDELHRRADSFNR